MNITFLNVVFIHYQLRAGILDRHGGSWAGERFGAWPLRARCQNATQANGIRLCRQGIHSTVFSFLLVFSYFVEFHCALRFWVLSFTEYASLSKYWIFVYNGKYNIKQKSRTTHFFLVLIRTNTIIKKRIFLKQIFRDLNDFDFWQCSNMYISYLLDLFAPMHKMSLGLWLF